MYKRAIFIDESIAYQLGPRIEFDGEGKFSQKSFQDAQDGEFSCSRLYCSKLCSRPL